MSTTRKPNAAPTLFQQASPPPPPPLIREHRIIQELKVPDGMLIFSEHNTGQVIGYRLTNATIPSDTLKPGTFKTTPDGIQIRSKM